MFGENKITKQDLTTANLKVKSVFRTIQGEGPYAGTPSIFVRLGGCCLACRFCDTDFETDLSEYHPDDLVARVVNEIGGRPIRLVVITGGEPLIQNIAPFIELLLYEGLDVQIETSGAVWSRELTTIKLRESHRITVVVSPKTPKVDVAANMCADYYKYIVKSSEVSSVEDGLPLFPPLQGPSTRPVLHNQTKHLFRPSSYFFNMQRTHIFIQPCDERAPELNCKNVDHAISIVFRYGYRLSLQQHKILGLE